MSNRKGFTLIELLIVVVIIGILAAIAIPKFANTKEKAVAASEKSDLRNLVTAQEGFFSDNQTYATGFGAAQANAPASPACGGTVAFGPTQGNLLVQCLRWWLYCSWLGRDNHQPGRDQRFERPLRHFRGRSGDLCRSGGSCRVPTPRARRSATKRPLRASASKDGRRCLTAAHSSSRLARLE